MSFRFLIRYRKIPAKLVMVGEGPEKEGAEFLCEQLGIADKVIFLAIVMKLIEFFAFQIFFCCPQNQKVLVWPL